MELGRIVALRGPNIWGTCPVLEAELLRCDGAARLDGTPAFAARLLRWVPSLASRDGMGGAPPFQGPFGLAHALSRLMIQLQSQAGSEVHLGLVDCCGDDPPVRVVVEYEEEELARACLGSARRLCLAALGDWPLDVAAEMKKLRE